MTHADLPLPDADAQAHSARLLARIREEVAVAGWLSFARYMELALYAPGLGYYSSPSRKFGAAGDFVTAPEISPLFGQTLATQVADLATQCGGTILEVGAGSGALAASLMDELARLGALPQAYQILELSADLRQRQSETLQQRVPDWVDRVSWLDRIPASFRGTVVANEVVDAMPVHLVEWREHDIAELGVAASPAGGLEWVSRSATGPLRAAARALPPQVPYRSEINLAARAWIREWGRVLDCGALLLVDYGFPCHEYYHPQRSEGTLMCHYRHHAHGDPLFLPGLNDITAHVDFTAIAEAALDGGMAVLGYTSQASFLLNCGIGEVLAREDPSDALRYLPRAAAAGKLLSPAEMGELFKVMIIGRGIEGPLRGFARGDRSHTL